jgi:hypothetical protein
MICGGPHRGATTKKQGGNGAKELRNGMGEMGVRRIGGKGGGHEEHGTLETRRVCTLEKKL